MRKTNLQNPDELKPEYDFASMKGGVQGKYVARLRREGSNLVLLDPEIAKAFPSDAAVNDALRGVLKKKVPRARSLGKKRKPARTASGRGARPQ